MKIGQVLVIPSKSAAAAKSADVDQIITGSAKPDKPAATAAAKTQKLPTYTAPKKAEASIAEAEKATAAAGATGALLHTLGLAHPLGRGLD